MINKPDFILYGQHGWADNDQGINKLLQLLKTDQTIVITPNLGWLNTWLSIQPLIDKLEKIVTEKIQEYPSAPIKIIGHSMGGLIWLEILTRNPQWHSQVDSLVLIASPVGGADLARIIDPFKIGIGIAKDLGHNRRSMAESIAKVIPTLVIAGDINHGSDGTIPIESTKFNYAKLVSFQGLSHAKMKSSSLLVETIQEFWQHPIITPLIENDLATTLIDFLRSVSGMTDTNYGYFSFSKPYFTFDNGITIKTWKNPLGINYVFIANAEDECVYAGFVGWSDNRDLENMLEMIRHLQN